jgi:hypothetical protein
MFPIARLFCILIALIPACKDGHDTAPVKAADADIQNCFSWYFSDREIASNGSAGRLSLAVVQELNEKRMRFFIRAMTSDDLAQQYVFNRVDSSEEFVEQSDFVKSLATKHGFDITGDRPLTAMSCSQWDNVRNITDLGGGRSDSTDAEKALIILGAELDGQPNEGHCKSCHHKLNEKSTYDSWIANMLETNKKCLIGETSADKQAKCLMDQDPAKLGFLRAGVHLDFFQGIFRAAYSDPFFAIFYNSFRDRTQMPKNGENPLAEGEFAAVRDWLAGPDPKLDIYIP